MKRTPFNFLSQITLSCAVQLSTLDKVRRCAPENNMRTAYQIGTAKGWALLSDLSFIPHIFTERLSRFWKDPWKWSWAVASARPGFKHLLSMDQLCVLGQLHLGLFIRKGGMEILPTSWDAGGDEMWGWEWLSNTAEHSVWHLVNAP